MSNCRCICTRSYEVSTNDEGTCYYKCLICKKPMNDADMDDEDKTLLAESEKARCKNESF